MSGIEVSAPAYAAVLTMTGFGLFGKTPLNVLLIILGVYISARLDLLGWQIKHSDVVRMGDSIKIDLWLGGDRFDSRQFNIPEDDES